MRSTKTTGLKALRLTTKSLENLNYQTQAFGWTAWTTCYGTRICLFDVESGQFLHRISFHGSIMSDYKILNYEVPRLLVAVKRKGPSKLIAYQPYIKPKRRINKGSMANALTEAPKKEKQGPTSNSNQ